MNPHGFDEEMVLDSDPGDFSDRDTLQDQAVDQDADLVAIPPATDTGHGTLVADPAPSDRGMPGPAVPAHLEEGGGPTMAEPAVEAIDHSSDEACGSQDSQGSRKRARDDQQSQTEEIVEDERLSTVENRNVDSPGQHAAASAPAADREDFDEAVLMALDTTPPWRRPRDPRSRWLRHDRDGRGRRERSRRPRRSRTRSANREARSWRSSRTAARPTSRPACSSHVRAPPHVETIRDDSDMVEVEVEPTYEPFATEDAMRVWLSLMELRPEGEEGSNLGLPGYLLNNIQATLEDYNAEDSATLLGLFQAQVAQLVDARMRQIRSSNAANHRRGPGEGDGLSLMQGSIFHVVKGELSTFALHMQQITDELSVAAPAAQAARAHVLRNLLAERYGSGVGRRLMLNRAQSLEAVTGAFSGSDLPEGPDEDDRAWAHRWWRVLLPAIRSEESLVSVPGVCLQVDSASTAPDVSDSQGVSDPVPALPIPTADQEGEGPTRVSGDRRGEDMDFGDAERQLHREDMLQLEAEARDECERMEAEEALYAEQRWETYLETRMDEATSSSESSTMRIDARQWQARKRLRVPEPDPVLTPATSSFEAGAVLNSDPGRATVKQEGLYVDSPLRFVQSPLGEVIFQWWMQGLVPSLLIASDLGLGVLQAFRAQRQLLEGEGQAGK